MKYCTSIAYTIQVWLIPYKYDYTVEVRNRFKGLYLIDRVPDELWMEVCDIVWETGIKTIPPKKEMQKKQNGCMRRSYITVKRRSEKQRGKEKIYHLNSKFQRIATREKKVFLSDQCK